MTEEADLDRDPSPAVVRRLPIHDAYLSLEWMPGDNRAFAAARKRPPTYVRNVGDPIRGGRIAATSSWIVYDVASPRGPEGRFASTTEVIGTLRSDADLVECLAVVPRSTQCILVVRCLPRLPAQILRPIDQRFVSTYGLRLMFDRIPA